MPDSLTPTPYSAFRDRPVDFARDVLSLSPTPQQEQFLAALAAPAARVAMRSGHGIGKSTALAAAAIWFLATRPDALVPCTAPTAHQLEDVLWREIRRLISNLDDNSRAAFQTTSGRVSLQGYSGMILARTSRLDNPDALQGFHAEELLFVIDEAAGVANTVFEVARGALSTPSARVALAGNPTRLTGYFHTAFHSARDTWTQFAFSCLESPLVSPDYPAEIEREYGRDSDMYRVRVLGEFPKASLHSLISRELASAALERGTKAAPAQTHAPVIIGVDPAWLGPDRSVAVLRQGRYARPLFVVRGVDTVRLARMIAREAAEWRPDAIFIDQTGIGAGVVDQLRLTRHPVTGIYFSGSALEPARFANSRAEMWMSLKKWLEEEPAIDGKGYAESFRDDLSAPEFHYTSAGKIQLESKEDMARRGFASPDLGDALALTFAMNVYKRSEPSPVAEPPPGLPDYSSQWMDRKSPAVFDDGVLL